MLIKVNNVWSPFSEITVLPAKYFDELQLEIVRIYN